MQTYKQYIGGVWREGSSESVLQNVNPYTHEVIYTYHGASEQDIDEAYRFAAEAQKKWAQVAPQEKVQLYEKLVQVIGDMRDEIVEVIMTEGGSIRGKAMHEAVETQRIVRQCYNYPYKLEGKIYPSDEKGMTNYVFRSPKGVFGVVSPWNFPLILTMRTVASAVALGNAVVLKPASDTPSVSALICKAYEKAGFPAGVVSCVAGKGSEIGDYFVEHPIPKLISFTGSSEVGHSIAISASKHLKEVALELGGNNAMIIRNDADVDKAVNSIVFGAFFNSGQVCMSLQRLIVEDKVYDEVVEKVAEAVSHLPVGDPSKEETFIGPMINEKQAAEFDKRVQGSLEQGARAVVEGHTENGNLVYPWVLADCTNDMPTCQFEMFGPIVNLIKVASDQEAIAVANDCDLGLSGSIFTEDRYQGMIMARQMETGMVHINDQSINEEPHVMFGGEKNSGIGRFNNQWAINEFTDDNWISVQDEPRW